MSHTDNDVIEGFVTQIKDLDITSDEATTAIKNLKTLAEAQKIIEPEPLPVPEPTGPKAFFSRHAGDLIKVGGTLSIVAIIAAIEAKGDVIFRSKATKYL